MVECLERTDDIAAGKKEDKEEDTRVVPADKGRRSGTDDEWSKFQSDFESLMTASEEQLTQEQQQAPDFSQLREELIMSVVASLSSCLTGNNDSNNSSGQDESDSHKHFRTSGLNGSSAGYAHGGVLQSSRFEHLSESELDRALEAIKEESREGSVSPPVDNR